MPTPWLPLGSGASLGFDWDGLSPTAIFDPYLTWFDLRAVAVDAQARRAPPIVIDLLLELKRPLADESDAETLRDQGLSITPHYLGFSYPNGKPTRYVTATAAVGGKVGVGSNGLTSFLNSVADGSHALVARYQISIGFASPDADAQRSLLGPGALLARRTKPPKIAPMQPLEGHLVGVIDYGCPFMHACLRDENGATRVRRLWDQQGGLQGLAPSARKRAGRKTRVSDPTAPQRDRLAWQSNHRFARGVEVDGEALSRFAAQYTDPHGLDEAACYRDAGYDPIRGVCTHGAHILHVATGHPDPTQGGQSRHPYPIVFVQLPRRLRGAQVTGVLPAQVLDAVHYIAAQLGQGAKGVINLSYGGYCGPHDGSSVLELALDEVLAAHAVDGRSRLQLVLPSGNGADQDTHAQVLLRPGASDTLRWTNSPDDPSDSFVELWVPSSTAVRMRVTPPGMPSSSWVYPGNGARLVRNGQVVGMVVATEQPCQAQSGTMTMLAVAPTAETSDGRAAAPYGVWSVELENVGTGQVLIHAWCERDDPIFGHESPPRQSVFLSHVEATGTLNSIAHGRRTIVVGGYHKASDDSVDVSGGVALMSGVGPGRYMRGQERHETTAREAAKPGPELLAPCSVGADRVGVSAAGVLSGELFTLTGTSVAAAWCTRKIIDAGFELPAELTPKARRSKASSVSKAQAVPYQEGFDDTPRLG